MMKCFESYARRGEVVVMAGAGVSAGKPSALPGWKPTNAAIVQILCSRLETATNKRSGWVSEFIPVITTEREADRFPPDYQAQLIEEMCGDRYFLPCRRLMSMSSTPAMMVSPHSRLLAP